MKRKTILVVEDNPDEAELALLGFKQFGCNYNVEIVSNGEEALEFLFAVGCHSHRPAEHKPDLVILDVDLPKLNGFEVLKRIRSDRRYQTTPVVMLTTSDEHSDILKGYKLGVSSYLCKPLDFDSFADLLQQVSRYWLTSPHVRGCAVDPAVK